MKRLILSLLTVVAILALVGCSTSPAATKPVDGSRSQPTAAGAATKQGDAVAKKYNTPPAMTLDLTKTYKATIQTTSGDMVADLFAKEVPVTVNSFVFLSREGFYDGVKFHRIIKGFMAQTGDPTGTGAGGPGYRFNDEKVTRNYVRGTLAMANAGPNTNGSQFFIVDKDYPLPKNYTIFGLLSGDDSFATLDKISSTPVTTSPSGEQSRPTKDVLITGVTISEE